MQGVSAIAVAECVSLSSWSSDWQLTSGPVVSWAFSECGSCLSLILLSAPPFYLYRPKFLADKVFQYCDLNCVFLKGVFKSESPSTVNATLFGNMVFVHIYNQGSHTGLGDQNSNDNVLYGERDTWTP